MTSSDVLTRRSFLHRAGGGLAAAALSPLALGAADRRRAPERTVGWAIVGLGYYATRQIMPRFAECEHSRITALVSGTPEKARKLAQEYGVDAASVYDYRSFDSIRDNPAVDVVYVVLPNGMHHEYAIRAAQAGKHVMCEKPMAVSVRECEEMIAACRAAGRKLMIGYRSRFEPHNRLAIEIARSGRLGPTRTIVADHGFDIGDPTQWRLRRALSGGGSLMDIGIYSLNAARYLTGEEPVEVAAMESTDRSDPRFREVEDTLTFQLRFPSGALATCVSSYTSAHNRYRLAGPEGWLELEPATSYGGQRMRVRAEGRTEEPDPGAAEVQFAGQLDHFSTCILEGKEPLVPGEEGLHDLRVMAAIYEAAREGRTVRL
jgi:glucose-fructose oxidoreductase